MVAIFEEAKPKVASEGWNLQKNFLSNIRRWSKRSKNSLGWGLKIWAFGKVAQKFTKNSYWRFWKNEMNFRRNEAENSF